jgi:ABC-type multidrug transport system fused ATPase/permease subunit
MDAISRLLSDHRAFMNQAKQLNRAKADSKPDAAHNHSHFLNKNPAHRAAHDDLTVSARIVAALGQLLSPSMRRAIVEVFANAPWRFILPACSFCMAWMASQFMRGRAIGGMIDILFKSQMPLTEDASPAAASTAQPTLQAMLIMPVVFAFFEWLFNVLWDFCMMKAKTALIVTGRTRYFRSIISQSLEFHSGSSSAELAARLISDSEAIDDAIVHAPCHLLRGLFTLVVAAYVISIDAWLFALGLVLRLPWLLQFVEYAITVVASYELLESNASHLAQAHANEVFASIVTVQACTAEDDETQEFKGHLQNVSRIADTGSVVACGLRNVENGLTLASEIVILAYGVSRVYNGHLTFGIFMALKAHMEMFISQFNFFEKAYVALKRASVQSARMFHFYDLHASSGEVLQQLPVVAPKSGLAQHALSLQQHPIIVEFSNVSFSYPKLPSQAENIHMPVVLSGVSFFVIQRSLTAILGASGSGKSSIGKLLLQFYKPTSGDVHVDGVACKSPESAHRAREMIAWVDQVIRFAPSCQCI